MKFTATQDYNGNNDSNRWQVMLGMRQLNAAPYCKGWGALTVNPDFVEAFPTGEGWNKWLPEMEKMILSLKEID